MQRPMSARIKLNLLDICQNFTYQKVLGILPGFQGDEILNVMKYPDNWRKNGCNWDIDQIMYWKGSLYYHRLRKILNENKWHISSVWENN